MAKREYTRKEVDAIHAAYCALEQLCVRNGATCENRLIDALHTERKERSSVTVAKALIIESAFDANYSKLRPADLYDYSPGLAVAIMVGDCLRLHFPEEWAKILPYANAAIKANKEASQRAIDAILAS